MRYLPALRLSIGAALISGLMCLASSVGVLALAVPPAPTDIPIVDQTRTLTTEQQQSLAKIIATEQASGGNQIGVLMISSLQGESIEDYSIKVAREWGIGSKEKNNGVLLLIAKDDHRLRIEVGYGLEGALTDVQSGRIIRGQITPQFKAGNYYAGIKQGIESIIKAIHGEAEAATPSSEDLSSVWEALLFFGFILSWVVSMLARTKSWWAGGVFGAVIGVIVGLLSGYIFMGVISAIILAGLGLLFDKLISANYQTHARRGNSPSWWAGGPFIGGGRSGGGFGGFGGGGFGGGGASGSW